MVLKYFGERRSKLAELKSKSKCMRCGVIGHWAGDPGCKFPGSKGAPKAAVKPTANFGDMSDSSEEDGITLSASPGRSNSHDGSSSVASETKQSSSASYRRRVSWLQNGSPTKCCDSGSRCCKETRGSRKCLPCWTVQRFDLLGCVV